MQERSGGTLSIKNGNFRICSINESTTTPLLPDNTTTSPYPSIIMCDELTWLRRQSVTMLLVREDASTETFKYTLGTLCTHLELQKHLHGFACYQGSGVYSRECVASANEDGPPQRMKRNPLFPHLRGPVVMYSGVEMDARLAFLEDAQEEEEEET